MKPGKGFRIYVAGAYSAPSQREIEANVTRAIDAGHRLMDLGFAPLVPHLSHWSEARRPRPYEDWMDLDLAWLPAAHAVFRLTGPSSGADREEALARALGVPVFRDEDALVEWAAARRVGGLEHVSVAIARGLAKVAAGGEG